MRGAARSACLARTLHNENRFRWEDINNPDTRNTRDQVSLHSSLDSVPASFLFIHVYGINKAREEERKKRKKENYEVS